MDADPCHATGAYMQQVTNQQYAAGMAKISRGRCPGDHRCKI